MLHAVNQPYGTIRNSEVSMVDDRKMGANDGALWIPLVDLFENNSPLFEKTLFMEGYDISSNVYAIAGDYITIVDPGNDYTAFMALFKNGHRPTDVRKIVLTHGHFEHVMGIFELLSYPSIAKDGEIEVILHESGPESIRERIEEYTCPLTLTEVGGGETLNLSGFNFEVIHTPGHTMDSICLFHSPTGSIFTGDTVLPYAVSSPDPAGGGKIEYHLFTLKQLLSLKIENLLPGHGSPVAQEGKKVIEGSFAGVIRRMVGLETSWLEGAAMLAGKGYLEESLFCCNKELEIDGENMAALELMGSNLNDLGRFGEAIGIFDRIAAKNESSAFAPMGKGYALLGLGRYEESLLCFDDALKKNPKIKGISIYMGMALYLSGRIEEALDIEEFNREFVMRFKDWIDKKAQPSDTPK